jgi:hypothetical protein
MAGALMRNAPATQSRLAPWAWLVIERAWVGHVLLGGTVLFPSAAGFVGHWSLRVILIGLGMVAVVLVNARANALARREGTRQSKVLAAAEKAVADYALSLGTFVEPLAELLGRLANTRRKSDRVPLRAAFVEKTLQAAVGICGPDDLAATRACFFSLDDGDLSFSSHAGRGAKPRHTLPTEAVQLAKARKSVLIKDVQEAPNPESFQGVSYGTFISCSVFAGEAVFGLLAVDAVEPGTLTKHDLRAATVLAHLLGTALSIADGG